MFNDVQLERTVRVAQVPLDVIDWNYPTSKELREVLFWACCRCRRHLYAVEM